VESNTIENDSRAAFVHGEYHIDERWSAAAGVRRTDDTRRLSENSYAVVPGAGQACTIIDATTGFPANGGGPCPPIDKSVGYGYWSWEFSTRYRLTPELNAYLRTGRGQRSGGWNAPVNTLQDQPFHPEQLTDYELGLKADLLGGALLVDGDVFYGNYDQMQRLLPRLVGGTPTTFVINAGKARVSGAEFESTLMVARGASAHLAAGWTDARYREFLYSADGVSAPADLSGNRFNATPRFNAGLGLAYDTRLGAGAVRLRADYAWQDTVQFNVINDFNSQGAYGTVNARATYAAPGGAWELALFGTNLGGRQYAVTGGSVSALPSPIPAFSWQIPGAPRMYGVELTLRVGKARNAPS
jgi:iron complex outermembrane receptor protein